MKPIKLACAFLLAVTLCGCQDHEQNSDVNSLSVAPVPVAVSTLFKRELTGTISLFGVMQPISAVSINADFSAPIARVLVEEGERVEANQPLLRFDTRKIELKRSQTEHLLEQARGHLVNAKQGLTRIKALDENSSVSMQQLDDAQAEYDSAHAAVLALESELQLAKQDLDNATLRSPIGGVITKRFAEPGENAIAFSTLLELEADYIVRVSVYASEKMLPLLRVGNRGTVESVVGQAHAQIVSIAANADPYTGNYEVRLILDNHEQRFKSGMSATVTIETALHEKHLIIPESALVSDAGEHVVFVVRDSTAIRTVVKVGLSISDELTVLAGLHENDVVVTKGAKRLVDGSPVSLGEIHGIE